MGEIGNLFDGEIAEESDFQAEREEHQETIQKLNSKTESKSKMISCTIPKELYLQAVEVGVSWSVAMRSGILLEFYERGIPFDDAQIAQMRVFLKISQLVQRMQEMSQELLTMKDEIKQYEEQFRKGYSKRGA